MSHPEPIVNFPCLYQEVVGKILRTPMILLLLLLSAVGNLIVLTRRVNLRRAIKLSKVIQPCAFRRDHEAVALFRSLDHRRLVRPAARLEQGDRTEIASISE